MRKTQGKDSTLFKDRGSIFDSPSRNSFMLAKSLDFSSIFGPLATESAESNAKLIRESSSLYSPKLTKLVFLYEGMLFNGESPFHAMNYLWETVDRWTKEKIISKAERQTLYKASEKDEKSIHVLINECPYVIRLPFVQDFFIDLLINYKITKGGKVDSPLKLIRQQWIKILPSRANNKVVLSKVDLNNMRNTELKHNKKDPQLRISSATGVSRRHLSSASPVKKGRGRLKQTK